MNSLIISQTTARRYILGKQGLWPGRRWVGKAGTAKAIRHMEAVQIDPLTVVARSHDLVLHSRVVDYRPEYLDRLMHHERQFFDYGGGLFIYPLDELPYWRVSMQRRELDPHWGKFAAENVALLDEIRQELHTRGPLGNRDFTHRARVSSYRARKDSGLALYYLWLTGELMTHHRQGNFERVYDFREQVAPALVRHTASVEEAEYFFALKAVAFQGLSRARAWANTFSRFIERRVDWTETQMRLEQLVATDELSSVQVEGWKEPHYCLSADRSILAQLEKGQVPKAWRPIDTTTDEEVVFLAPLEIVSARGRAKTLFDFDYVWEIYKPAHTRRWGYYTLPILYGDRLVARIDPKLDRSTQTLIIKGLWLEDAALADDLAFTNALARGLQRFVEFMRAEQLDLSALQPRSRRRLTAEQKAIAAVRNLIN